METEVLKIEAGNGRIILFYSSFLDWYKKENTKTGRGWGAKGPSGRTT